MPAYRMGAFIGEALASVAAQTHRAWEVIVVDDHGPEDGTAAIVQRFAEEHPKHRVEIIRHHENRGVSAARNTGINAAQGDCVAFLDPDDLWQPHHLERRMADLLVDPHAAVSTSRAGVFISGEQYDSHSAVWRDWMFKRWPYSLSVACPITLSATVVRSSVLRELGGFDTAPEVQHAEDYDLWIRIALSGHGFRFDKRPSVRYRKHAGAATNNKARMVMVQRAVAAKHADFFADGHRRMLFMALEQQGRVDGLLGGWLFRLLHRMDRWWASRIRAFDTIREKRR
jgi:glycosyltransferase involved in cell wall biosynthesis